MNKTSRTITRNAGFLMVSQVITWGLTLPMVVVMSRYLGAAGVGNLQLADSIWGIIGVIAAFGGDILLVKDIARTPQKAAEYFSISAILRSVLYILGFAAVALYARLARYSQETTVVIYLIGISWLFILWGGSAHSVLQGLERMEYFPLGDTVSKAFLMVAGILLMLRGYGVYPVSVVVILSAVISLIIQFIALRRITPLHFYMNGRAAWQMFKSGIPYLASSVFLVAYLQIDIIIISMLVNQEAVGWYSATGRLVGTFLFIPTVFITAIFPALSRMFAYSPESLPRILSKSFDLMLITGVPIGLGILAIANPLVVILFGKGFAPSGPILATRGIVLILTYLTMLLGYFCISTNKQNIWTVVMVAATVVTIPLDLILVPMCQKYFGNGAIGGSLSFIVTESAMVVIGIRLLPKKSLGWANVWLAARVLIAGMLMVLSVWWLRGYFIAVPILAGAIVYLVFIYLFRVFTLEDRTLLRQMVQIALARLRVINPRPASSQSD